MGRLDRIIFGRIEFDPCEEHLEFQFKFLCIVLICGALFTAVFVLGEYTRLNPLNSPHVLTMHFFIAAALSLWLLLRGQKQRFLAIAWIYEAICIIEYTSVLAYVPQDELRILWLFTNIPGVYLLLGRQVGFVITALSLLGLILGNASMSQPYSQPALATAVVCMIYLALFFHVFASRSVSYYVRMRESNARLYLLAMRDPLTGILNARAYYEICDRLIAAAQRSGRPYAVLFVDLDHFKAINDRHGHAAGDVVLKRVGETLGASIRSSDTLGRIGGEEFSVFLPDTSRDAAVLVAENLRRAVERLAPDIGGGECLRVTTSIGVAGSEGCPVEMQVLQRCADQAMYRAKMAGRNQVSVFVSEPQPAPPVAVTV
ncbi:GGDEF domain-containing protein [Dechloromonas sp. ZY10]|uniref:GGDEF domain-containing protein n=1 Tax=Dechloromonas aquae TaxID=2664436 RepID=UPI0035285201